ncbi:MAG TPA: alpha/beta fold hydrolase [Actinomycetota bacterium]|nr:alpha/beta fold hydrolase [Actinomycetota bacterium]
MAIKKSTIVRAYARLTTSGTRALFWLLERCAPGLGGRWAEHLWFTLPRSRSAASPARTGPAGAGTAFEVAVDGRRVRGRRWGGSGGPVVYLVHGWGGSARQLDALVSPLVGSGFSVVSFDAPSHGVSDRGASGPRSSTIPEAGEALLAVVARYGPAYGVVAHSLGATAAAVALRDGLRASRMVLIAPLAHPLPYSHAFAERLGFGERIRTRLVARIERRVGLPMSHFDVPGVARQVATPKLLVVHDRDDRETSWSDGRAIARAWPDARLLTTTRLGHRRILHDPEVVAQVVGFLRDATGTNASEVVAS